MKYEEAIKSIVGKWDELYKKQQGGFSHPQYIKTPAVWVAKSDLAYSYEVNEEWIGVSKQGDITWAYASGCSCWDGYYDEDTKPTVKEFTLVHQIIPEEWEVAIIKFAETSEVQDLSKNPND